MLEDADCSNADHRSDMQATRTPMQMLGGFVSPQLRKAQAFPPHQSTLRRAGVALCKHVCCAMRNTLTETVAIAAGEICWCGEKSDRTGEW
jgi:hypothetical protein